MPRQKRTPVAVDPAPAMPMPPRYQQVRDALVRRIAAGEWRAGAIVPSELSIASEYGVAPGTARKAVDLLVQERILVRHQGKGTFVATFDWPKAISQFFRMIADDGSRELPLGQTVRHEVAVATAMEAARLHLRAGTRVIRFLRVRYYGDQPVIVERLALPVPLFRDLATESSGNLPPALYEHYGRRYGVLIIRAVENLRAIAADEEDARLLKVPRNHPLLQIERVAHQIEGRPVEWRVSRCLTTQHSYQNEIA